jgi:hypothetical protein
MKAGVAISPDTPSTAITDQVAAAADMLLVMTVYPGASISVCDEPKTDGTIQAEADRNSWNAVYPR